MKPLHEAAELAAFQNEPKQLPSGAHGKNGLLRLGFARRGGRTVLAGLTRRTPLLAQRALYYDEAMPDLPCVMIVSTAGGVLQGDRSAIEIVLAPDCEAHVTTQSATKIQEMDANFAAQTQAIALDENAYLEFLPEPIIPYRSARFITHTRISLPVSATVLYAEVLQPGRTHYNGGERFAYDVFSSTIRVERPDGTALCGEKFVITPHLHDVHERSVMGRYDVYANVLLLTPPRHAQAVFDGMPAAIDSDAGIAYGASRLPGDAGIVYKVLGMTREAVQAQVRAFWSAARQQIKGRDIPREFLWR